MRVTQTANSIDGGKKCGRHTRDSKERCVCMCVLRNTFTSSDHTLHLPQCGCYDIRGGASTIDRSIWVYRVCTVSLLKLDETIDIIFFLCDGNGRKNIQKLNIKLQIEHVCGCVHRKKCKRRKQKLAANNFQLFCFIFPSLVCKSIIVRAHKTNEKQWDAYLCTFSERLTLAVDEFSSRCAAVVVRSCWFKRKRKHPIGNGCN